MAPLKGELSPVRTLVTEGFVSFDVSLSTSPGNPSVMASREIGHATSPCRGGKQGLAGESYKHIKGIHI